jgi:hypothetical protein
MCLKDIKKDELKSATEAKKIILRYLND